MSAIKEWFISGALHLVVGFLAGWLVFKRPDLMSKILYKISGGKLGNA